MLEKFGVDRCCCGIAELECQFCTSGFGVPESLDVTLFGLVDGSTCICAANNGIPFTLPYLGQQFEGNCLWSTLINNGDTQLSVSIDSALTVRVLWDTSALKPT